MKHSQYVKCSRNITIKKIQQPPSQHPNKLSSKKLDKLKKSLPEGLFKKSSSLVTLFPSTLPQPPSTPNISNKSKAQIETLYKMDLAHKHHKLQTKLSQQLHKSKYSTYFQSKDSKDKRKKIYHMGSLVQQSSQQQDQQDDHIHNYSTYNQKSDMKIYTETTSTTSSSKPTLQLKINQFQLGKILGFGKFGQVYMARHVKSGFICAIKQIPKKNLDHVQQNQLIREIKIQMYLDHPNIDKMYTFFSDSNNIYLVLQLCTSGQLYNFLQKHQPIQQNLAKVIIKQICQGLDYLHQNNVIHRDIKPQNILFHNVNYLLSKSMMKISDFGWSIATPLMRETFCGTPLYFSPQLLKKNYYNHKIDTWSLGVLSYQVLLGQVPFQIFCQADYNKILKNQVRFPKCFKISDQAKYFIHCCLEKDPNKRMSCKDLLELPFLKNVQLTPFAQLY